MRKYILGLLLIFWGICGGQAQTEGRYKMTLTFSSIKNTGNDMKSTEYRVSSISDAGSELLPLLPPSFDISMPLKISSPRS